MLTLHQARSLLIGERTAVVSHTRRLLGEYGLVMAQGVAKVGSRLPEILEVADNGLPGLAREVFAELARASEAAHRLMQVEGVGPLTATAITATVGDARQFRNGRQFAARVGLAARQALLRHQVPPRAHHQTRSVAI